MRRVERHQRGRSRPPQQTTPTRISTATSPRCSGSLSYAANNFGPGTHNHPYGLEISTHIEHELLPSLSLRGSYVFKGTRTEWAEIDTLLAGAMTVPFDFLDPGPDGLTGTADDQTVQLLGMAAGTGSNRIYGNPEKYGLPGFEANYHTVEFAVNRRLKDKWMLLTSFEHTGRTPS